MRDLDGDTQDREVHDELRDIHRRIDTLEKESERQFDALVDKLHGVELAVARGGRFPASLYGAVAAIFLAVLGGALHINQQIGVIAQISTDAKRAIENHITEMGPAEALVWKMEERIKALEGRIVGQGPEGWHRRDHNQYAETINARFELLDHRLQNLEKRK